MPQHEDEINGQTKTHACTPYIRRFGRVVVISAPPILPISPHLSQNVNALIRMHNHTHITSHHTTRLWQSLKPLQRPHPCCSRSRIHLLPLRRLTRCRFRALETRCVHEPIHLRRTPEDIAYAGHALLDRLLLKVFLEPFPWPAAMVLEQVLEIGAWCAAACYACATGYIER